MEACAKRLYLAAVLIVSLVTVLLPGCGTGSAALLENPLEFFRQAREKMVTVDSFRAEGKAESDLIAENDTLTMTMEYNMVYERKSDGKIMIMMEISANAAGRKAETLAYLAGGRMYMKTPEGKWVYREMSMLSKLDDMGQDIGPQNMMQLLETAESAEVLDEDGSSITYKLAIDYEKMLREQQDLLDEMKADFDASGMSFDEYNNMMELVYSNTDYIIIFDKKSGLARAFEFHIDMDRSILAEMFPDDPPPQDARMVMNGVFEIGDYGKVFDLELPEEAQDAVPIEELEGSVRT